jgi:hypothetical protein
VKAKIDNVKAKIQDKEEKGPWSRPTLARRPVFGQLAASPTSFPPEELPRKVSASHDSKFISIVRRARMVSAGDNGIYTGSGLRGVIPYVQCGVAVFLS